MASYFPSWRQTLAACAAGLMTSTPVIAAPIDIHWPEITLTWPPSPPDMLLIGSGVVLVLVLLFALMRSGSNARRQSPPSHGNDLRWWKNPPESHDHTDPMSSLPR